MGVSVFIERLLMARTDGTYLKLRDRLIKVDFLIIDDIGLKKIPPQIVQGLHDLLEERQEKCTLITSQLPLKNWSEIIDDELALDTVVDKLQHGSLHIDIPGESYRKKKGQAEKCEVFRFFPLDWMRILISITGSTSTHTGTARKGVELILLFLEPTDVQITQLVRHL